MIFLELFWVFFLIGAFTFGGGYAMIAMIQQQVSARGWMGAEELVDFIAIAESTPGPIAVNMATFVGAKMGGVAGAACATLGVVLPSFVVILIVARCFRAFCGSKWVQGVMSGLKPAVVGLIASAVLTVAGAVFTPGGISSENSDFYANGSNWLWLAVAGVLLAVSLKWKKLHPIVIISICAVIGIAAGYLGI